MNNSESSAINYLHIITKWRKLIIINFLVVAFLTAGFSLIMPKTFSAHTSILSPTGDDSNLGLSSLLSSLPIPSFGFGGVSEATYTFIAILNSRTVMERIVKEFSLVERYNADNIEDTVGALREAVAVELNEDLTIRLTAQATTKFLPTDHEETEARKLARDMTNAFIQELDSLNRELKTEHARNHRIFIERRYLQNLTDLKTAEDELRVFQETHGVIALTEQMQATIQAAAGIQAEITAKEVEVAVMTDFVSSSHQQFVQARTELNELRRKYEQMTTGEPIVLAADSVSAVHSSRLFLPLSQAPDIGLRYLRLFREVTVQQKILEFMLPQYEQAKIQEAKDSPTVQVLDPAVLPIRRSKPKRALLTLLAGFVSIAFSLILAFSIEHIRSLQTRNDANHEKLQDIYLALSGDIRRLFRKTDNK